MSLGSHGYGLEGRGTGSVYLLSFRCWESCLPVLPTYSSANYTRKMLGGSQD